MLCCARSRQSPLDHAGKAEARSGCWVSMCALSQGLLKLGPSLHEAGSARQTERLQWGQAAWLDGGSQSKVQGVQHLS